MPRVLIIAYNYPPLNNGGVPRSLKLEKFLPASGIIPIILTQSFDGPELNIDKNLIRIRDFARHSNGLDVRTSIRALRKTSRLMGKYFSSYDLWKKRAMKLSWKILEYARPDLIVASFPPVAGLELGMHLAEIAGVPFIPDFRDGLLHEPVGPGHEYSHIKSYHRKVEELVVEKSSAIITVSDTITDYFQRQYNLENVHTVTNGYDCDDFENLPSIDYLAPDKFNIVYTGRLSLSDITCDAFPFFNALEDIATVDIDLTSKIHLHMIGEFTREESDRIDSLSKMCIATRHNMVSKKLALAFQKGADLLLLITSVGRKSVITGKLFEYLYAQKPILGLTYNTAAAEIIERTGSGWTTHPHNQDKIVEILSRLIRDPQMLHSLERNHELIKKYSYHRQIDILGRLIHKVTAGITT